MTSPTAVIVPTQQVLSLNPMPPVIAKLDVPTPLLTNNTPTPVKNLLREAQEGIPFNPFDEHFRKAINDSKQTGTVLKEVRVAAEDDAGQNKEETLNTPQILLAPSDLATSSIMLADSVKDQSSKNSKDWQSDKAKLVLKLPGGQAVQLSEIPVVQEQTQQTAKIPIPRESKVLPTTSKTESPPKKRQSSSAESVEEKRKKILERNAAAAKRSRNKKKEKFAELEDKFNAMAARNKNLVTENDVLRREIVTLKTLLMSHRNCPVAKELNQETLISEQVLPKAVSYSGILPSNAKLVAINEQSQFATLTEAQIREMTVISSVPSTGDILQIATQSIGEGTEESDKEKTNGKAK